MLGLRTSDVIFGKDTAAVQFDRADRGERSKTGREQGACVDFPRSVDISRQRVANAKAGGKLFPIP